LCFIGDVLYLLFDARGAANTLVDAVVHFIAFIENVTIKLLVLDSQTYFTIIDGNVARKCYMFFVLTNIWWFTIGYKGRIMDI